MLAESRARIIVQSMPDAGSLVRFKVHSQSHDHSTLLLVLPGTHGDYSVVEDNRGFALLRALYSHIIRSGDLNGASLLGSRNWFTS
jgi:hypothetical protein